MRQIRPLAARLIQIQNRIPYPSQLHFQGAARTDLFFSTQAFFHYRPFFVRQITGVVFLWPHFYISPFFIQITNL